MPHTGDTIVSFFYDDNLISSPSLVTFIGERIKDNYNSRIDPLIKAVAQKFDKLNLAQQIEMFDLTARYKPKYFEWFFPTEIPDTFLNEASFQQVLGDLLAIKSYGVDSNKCVLCDHLKNLVKGLIINATCSNFSKFSAITK